MTVEPVKPEDHDITIRDDVWDNIYNFCRTVSETYDPKIWRWPPHTIQDWIMREDCLNLKGEIRPPVFNDICEFFKCVDGNPFDRVYDEAILCEGIGSGKSFKMAVICTYFIHLILCLKNPAKFFGQAKGAKIAIMNMCFAGDQKIRRPDGSEVSFKTLFESQEEIEATAYDLNTEMFRIIKAKKCVEAGVKKLFKVTLGNGRMLRLTGNHPLLMQGRGIHDKLTGKSEWTAVEKLRAGDLIKTGAYLPTMKPSGFSSDELKLLAYLYGDTRISGESIQFLTCYRRIFTDFKELCKKFDVVHFNEHDKGDLHCISLKSAKITALAKRAGINGDERTRYIPQSIVQAPENEACLFLNRLWATYGSVNVGHKLSVNFTSPSDQFARDVSDMLLRFGIVSRYYSSSGKYRRDRETLVYRLLVSDTESKQIFIDRIGRYDLKLEGCQMLKGNLGRRFDWTNIETIEPMGEEMTYDIEVPELNNLVVNGIVCHNSISERNARHIVLGDIKQKIEGCKWFQEKPWDREDGRMPDPKCMSELRFKNNLYVLAGSSSWRTAVGFAIAVGIIDEAGSYRATDNSDQAEDIYLTMKRRLGSRFENRGAIVVGGSPMYESDFLERRLELGEKTPRAFCRRRTLWESKYHDWQGTYFYVDKVNRIYLGETQPANMQGVDAIPNIEFLRKAFEANATKAYRDYGARPSPTICGFFEQPKIVIERANKARADKDPIDKYGRFKEWFRPVDPKIWHAVHVDLAISGDACGVAMGHYAGKTAEGGIKVYIDLMMRLVGSKDLHISFEKVREYIYSLSTMGFKIWMITYDGFQSEDSRQILKAKGYRTDLLSVDKTTQPYYNLKEAINEDRLDYYIAPSGDSDNLSASEVFARECMRLEEVKGKKIDHPPKGGKDVADAVCGVTHNLIVNHKKFVGVKADTI